MAINITKAADIYEILLEFLEENNITNEISLSERINDPSSQQITVFNGIFN